MQRDAAGSGGEVSVIVAAAVTLAGLVALVAGRGYGKFIDILFL